MWFSLRVHSNTTRSRTFLQHFSYDQTQKCIPTGKKITFIFFYLIRLEILVALRAQAVPSTRGLVMILRNPTVKCSQMLSVVNPDWRYSIYCLVWYWNSNQPAAVSWASDDKLPLVPLADAFEMNYSELFWRI